MDDEEQEGEEEEIDPSTLAPVIFVLPTIIPPLSSWTSHRRTYMQLALRLRRMGYCVVVAELTYFPEARVRASLVDLRLALRWCKEHIASYGGDHRRIHLLGHGLSAHLAMLLVSQEAVVLSREAHLDRAFERERYDNELAQAHGHAHGQGPYARHEHEYQAEEEDEDQQAIIGKVQGAGERLSAGALARHQAGLAAAAAARSQQQQSGKAGGSSRRPRHTSGAAEENNWVDEDSLIDASLPASIPPPGLVSDGRSERPAHDGAGTAGSSHLLAFPSSSGTSGGGGGGGPRYPSVSSSGGRTVLPPRRELEDSLDASTAGARALSASFLPPPPPAQSQQQQRRSASSASAVLHERHEPRTLAEAEEQISLGLRRVEIYEPQIEVPPIAGVILLAGISDVIKGFRSETDRGVEHLSVLRRAMGPSHVDCLVSATSPSPIC